MPEPETPELSLAPAPESTAPETPAKNDADAKIVAPDKIGIGEKLLRAGKAFRDAAGRIWLKSGGRPRKDGQPASGDVLLEDAPDVATAPVAATPLAPPDLGGGAKTLPDGGALLRKAIVGAARSVFGILGDVIKIFGREPLGEKFCEEVVAKAKPDPGALDEWSAALETLLAKHNVSTVNAPEWTFALNTARMLAPYGVVLMEIRAELARKRALENEPPKK